MQITNESVIQAMESYAPRNFLEILQNVTTDSAYGYIVCLFTRGGQMPSVPGADLHQKYKTIANQHALLAFMLLPIWLQRNKSLPVISKQDILTVFQNKPEHIWEPEWLLQEVLTANEVWHNLIRNLSEKLDPISRHFTLGIAQAFMTKLAEQEKIEERENKISIDQQLQDILGPQTE